jgi:hypothetical protein
MQSSGESEFSSGKSESKEIVLGFVPSLLITVSGGAGLISMLTDGNVVFTSISFVVTIVTLLYVIFSSGRGRKTKN